MGGLLVLLVAGAGFMILLSRGARHGSDPDRRERALGPTFRFRRAASLLRTPGERAAWKLLHELALGAHAVCPKVRLEDIAEADGPDWRRLRNYVRARHVDFVLVDDDWQPLLVVEVDGPSHATGKARANDALKDRILASAGIPLLRLRHGTDWRAQLTAWAEQATTSRAVALR